MQWRDFCTKTGFSEAEVINAKHQWNCCMVNTLIRRHFKDDWSVFTGKTLMWNWSLQERQQSFLGKGPWASRYWIKKEKCSILCHCGRHIGGKKETQLKLAEFEQAFRTAWKKLVIMWEHDMLPAGLKHLFSNITSEISGYLTGNPRKMRIYGGIKLIRRQENAG